MEDKQALIKSRPPKQGEAELINRIPHLRAVKAAGGVGSRSTRADSSGGQQGQVDGLTPSRWEIPSRSTDCESKKECPRRDSFSGEGQQP